ncbi:hypothetical protein L2E82_38535 [Cichorium intybus]|uniref:Uncharacterized protein n=1 Tax=Cichorium intybus TaxID=13427 RepID=A0ACB9AG53_CICIN|nr:hypothetical protein L2E82_38535 [Cichorium intybus]
MCTSVPTFEAQSPKVYAVSMLLWLHMIWIVIQVGVEYDNSKLLFVNDLNRITITTYLRPSTPHQATNTNTYRRRRSEPPPPLGTKNAYGCPYTAGECVDSYYNRKGTLVLMDLIWKREVLHGMSFGWKTLLNWRNISKTL